jgi:shikimate kinase
MIVLIVGPSGVGKTSTCQAAEAHFPGVIFQPLDGLAARWALQKGIIDRESVTLLNRTLHDAEKFLSIGLLATGKLKGENPGKHLVIDVGAGFQVSPVAAKLHRLFQIIAITAEARVAFSRIQHNRNDQRSFEQYHRDEFSANRVAVYRSAHHTIESSKQSPAKTALQLIDILESLLGNSQ